MLHWLGREPRVMLGRVSLSLRGPGAIAMSPLRRPPCPSEGPQAPVGAHVCCVHTRACPGTMYRQAHVCRGVHPCTMHTTRHTPCTHGADTHNTCTRVCTQRTCAHTRTTPTDTRNTPKLTLTHSNRPPVLKNTHVCTHARFGYTHAPHMFAPSRHIRAPLLCTHTACRAVHTQSTQACPPTPTQSTRKSVHVHQAHTHTCVHAHCTCAHTCNSHTYACTHPYTCNSGCACCRHHAHVHTHTLCCLCAHTPHMHTPSPTISARSPDTHANPTHVHAPPHVSTPPIFHAHAQSPHVSCTPPIHAPTPHAHMQPSRVHAHAMQMPRTPHAHACAVLRP